MSITEDHADRGPQITTNHPLSQGALKFSVKPGPSSQGGCQLLSQPTPGLFAGGCDRFSAGILEHSPSESLPSLQSSGLAAAAGREAAGWASLGALCTHTSWSSHRQDTQHLGATEQSQKRLWGALCWEESSRHQFVTDADATSLLQKESLALLGLI